MRTETPIPGLGGMTWKDFKGSMYRNPGGRAEMTARYIGTLTERFLGEYADEGTTSSYSQYLAREARRLGSARIRVALARKD